MRERGEDEPAGGLGGPSGPEPGELDRGEKGEADGALCEGEDEQSQADDADEWASSSGQCNDSRIVALCC